MAINPIQFQKGLSLTAFIADFGTEMQCSKALQAARWPHGFICGKCTSTSARSFYRGTLAYWHCNQCNHQTSLYSGTLFEHTLLPLTKWFLAMYLITQSKTNMAALELRRKIGVSWKSAWLLKHKLMEAMYQREAPRSLAGTVVIDDAYLGGELNGGKRGRGSENKVPFIAAVQMRDGKPQRVRFDVVSGFTFTAVEAWGRRFLAPDTVVYSDGLYGFERLRVLPVQHIRQIAIKGKKGTEIAPFKWINILLGNLKTSLAGTYHAFHFAKYGHRYLADVQYRFNRKFDLAAMPQRLLCAMLKTAPCPRRRIAFAEIGT